MKAAVLVWAMRHSETWQQDLLLGPDRTQLPHTISNLLSAWYAWRAFDMAGPLAEHIVWDVTPTGFDASLLAHTAAIREQHLDWVAAHIKACPRCRDNPCVIVDGKAGARRLICAGQSSVHPMPASRNFCSVVFLEGNYNKALYASGFARIRLWLEPSCFFGPIPDLLQE